MARAFGDGGSYGGAAAGFVGSTQFGGHEMTEVWLKVLWVSGTTSVVLLPLLLCTGKIVYSQ